MAKVILQNLTKKYGDLLAVDDLSMEVRDKEFLVLVGPSGCGKTTVLRIIAGLETITSGDIYIGDRLVNNLHPQERDIAMVFSSPDHALYPNMSAYDNMAFSLRVRKQPPTQDESQDSPQKRHGIFGRDHARREEQIRGRVEQVAGSLGLSDYLNRKRGQLSGGHMQSVALGRAMVREPSVFLMDDPMSQLDAGMRASARAELQKLHRSAPITTLYVTHDQQEAMTLGDRIAVMNEGVLQQIGTPRILYDHPANMFVAGFIGSPPMNMLVVTLEGDPDGPFLSGPAFRIKLPDYLAERLQGYQDRQIVLGLRPESIRDAQYVRDTAPTAIVKTQVELREYLGNDIYLHLAAGGQSFVARVDNRTFVQPSQPLTVTLDIAAMHAFDPTTQRALL